MADIQLPDGSFIRLPSYALESTQAKMLRALEAQLGKDTQAIKLYGELLKETAEAAENAEDHQKYQVKHSKSQLRTLKDLLNETVKSNRALKFAMAAGKDLASSFRQVASLGVAASLAAVSLTKLAKDSVMGFGATLTELTQQGVGLTDVRGSAMRLIGDLQQLGFTSAEAAGTMATFSKVVQTAGKREFAGLQQSFAEATRYGSMFGMTMAEASEILNEDLELRQRLGILQSLDHHQQARMSRDLFKMQMESAAVLGRSIDEIRKLSMDVMDDPIAAITAQQIGMLHGTEAMQKFVKGIQTTTTQLAGMGLDDSLVAAIMEQSQAIAPFADQAGQELLVALSAAGAPGKKLADDILNMQQLTARARAGDAAALAQVDGALARMQRGVEGLANMSEKDLQTVMNLIGKAGGQFTANIASASRQIPQALANLAAASDAQVDGLMEGAAAFRQAFAQVRGLVQSGFSTIVSGFAEPMKKISEAFTTSGEGVNNVFKSITLASQDINAALRSLVQQFVPLDGSTEELRVRLNQLVESISTRVQEYIERFGNYLEEVGGPGALFDKFVNTLINVIGTVTRVVEFIGAINWKTALMFALAIPFAKAAVAGISAAFLKPMVVKGISAMLGKLGIGAAGKAGTAVAGTATAKTAATTVAATTATKAATAGTTAAKTGMLAKTATGMGAMAAMAVPLLKLAGAIGVIGAVIAGATWLMGKVLPTFAEGLKAFEDVDGKNLVQVAKGVGALGLAMAAMGVGGAIGAIGNAAANLWDGLNRFFGGKDQMQKLKEFGDFKFDVEGVKRNSEAAVAFGRALSAMGEGSAAGRRGFFATIGGAIADGVRSMFGGGTSIYDNLVTFGNLDLNLEKIRNNALATVAFTQAMEGLSSVSGAGSWRNLFGNLADGITSLFRGSTPWDKLEEFGKMELGAGIIDNANILRSYGEAIGAFTGDNINVADLGRSAEHLSRLATIYQRFAQLNASRMNNSVAAIRDLNNALVFGREQPTPDTAAAQPLAATEGAQDRQLQNLLENSSDEGVRMLADALLESNRTTHRLLKELNTSIQNQ